jgi:hypothetical protein
MENESLISLQEISTRYEVEISFLHSLADYGLVEITEVEATHYLKDQHLKDLEKMIRLHYDLDINMAGIDAIGHLLQRMDTLRDELLVLKNRLRRYEGD